MRRNFWFIMLFMMHNSCELNKGTGGYNTQHEQILLTNEKCTRETDALYKYSKRNMKINNAVCEFKIITYYYRNVRFTIG